MSNTNLAKLILAIDDSLEIPFSVNEQAKVIYEQLTDLTEDFLLTSEESPGVIITNDQNSVINVTRNVPSGISARFSSSTPQIFNEVFYVKAISGINNRSGLRMYGGFSYHISYDDLSIRIPTTSNLVPMFMIVPSVGSNKHALIRDIDSVERFFYLTIWLDKTQPDNCSLSYYWVESINNVIQWDNPILVVNGDQFLTQAASGTGRLVKLGDCYLYANTSPYSNYFTNNLNIYFSYISTKGTISRSIPYVYDSEIFGGTTEIITLFIPSSQAYSANTSLYSYAYSLKGGSGSISLNAPYSSPALQIIDDPVIDY